MFFRQKMEMQKYAQSMQIGGENKRNVHLLVLSLACICNFFQILKKNKFHPKSVNSEFVAVSPFPDFLVDVWLNDHSFLFSFAALPKAPWGQEEIAKKDSPT